MVYKTIFEFILEHERKHGRPEVFCSWDVYCGDTNDYAGDLYYFDGQWYTSNIQLCPGGYLVISASYNSRCDV